MIYRPADKLEHLIFNIKDYQLTHGSLLKLVRLEEPSTVPAKPVGVSIVPTRFARRHYDEAVAMQGLSSALYIRAACDHRWLHTTLGPLLKRDAFLSSLWDIHLEVEKAGHAQNIVCSVFRSDYMVHNASNTTSIKQVEMNAFSVAGACHAERVAHMHRHLRRVENVGQALPRETSLPSSSNTSSIVSLLSAAHTTYVRTTNKSVCVLMIVQPRNFNIADERPIEYGLWDQEIPCYRCEWQTILDCTTPTAGRTLLFRPRNSIVELEVSVIYYRAGYEATEYDEDGRNARLRLELSRAIKCPDVLTHLTTFKAVQQALIRPEALERFVSHEDAANLRNTFMDMHVLDNSPEGQYSQKLSIDPVMSKDFVLKPNLEGGGHNVYREDIPKFLSSIPNDDWKNYVLMRLIEPPPARGVLMMPSEIYQGPVVSELGILGTCMWKRDGEKVEMLQNDVGGWTFKTKPAHVDEMSVVKGYGCFDCPALTDEYVGGT